MKEEEDPAKEAFNGAAFAQFLFGPGGRQAGAIFLSFGVPGDHRHRTQNRMDPSDETQAPVGGVQADDARADVIETHRPLQEWSSERSIMDVGWGEQKEERQTGAATEQGMHAIAAQEWTGMLSGGMTVGGIRVGSAPAEN